MADVFQSHSIDLGHGFAVEFTLADGRFDAAWAPRLPHGRRARQILPAYKVARDAFLLTVGEKLGTNIMVVDL